MAHTDVVSAHSSAFTGTHTDQFLHVFSFGPYTNAAPMPLYTNGTYNLMTIPFKCSIEKITVRCKTKSADNGDTEYISFYVGASGTAPATAISGTIDVYTLTDATAFDIPLTTINGTASTAHKNLQAGTALAIKTEGTISTLAELMIEVVVRREPFHTADSGNVIQG